MEVIGESRSSSPAPKLATPLTKRRKWIEDRQRVRDRHRSADTSEASGAESDAGGLPLKVDGSSHRLNQSSSYPEHINGGDSSHSVLTDGTVVTLGTEKMHTH